MGIRLDINVGLKFKYSDIQKIRALDGFPKDGTKERAVEERKGPKLFLQFNGRPRYLPRMFCSE
jgi:hypothetical protein